MGIERSMGRSDFVFDSINKRYYKCHRISINCRRLYIDSPDWIKRIGTNNIKKSSNKKSNNKFGK